MKKKHPMEDIVLPVTPPEYYEIWRTEARKEKSMYFWVILAISDYDPSRFNKVLHFRIPPR